MAEADRFHSIEKIAEDTYRIDEAGIANCYLLLGNEKALLIDTGNGVGNILKAVHSVTSLPVEVVLTHRHCDHAGGAGWFDSVYVHEADLAPIYGVSSSRISSRGLVQAMGQKFEFIRPPHRARCLPMTEGHTFSLGGRCVSVVHTPGHTRGCVTLLDDHTKLMFTGDNVAPRLWMWLPGTTSVEAWLPSAKRTLTLSESYTPFWGHMDGRQDAAQIRRLVETGEALLASVPKNAGIGRTACYPAKDAEILIQYNTGRVHSRR